MEEAGLNWSGTMTPALLVTLLLLVGSSTSQLLSEGLLEKEARLPKDCGKTNTSLNTAIIGGKNAIHGEFPWIALILYKNKKEPKSGLMYSCGGSLITSRHVLTAAHCLHQDSLKEQKNGGDVLYTPVKVRMGELDISRKDDGSVVDYNVGQVMVHSGWNRKKKVNDIGIIKLKEEVKFTPTISPICLPSAALRSQPLVGIHPEVAGWGMVGAQEAKGATMLQKVKVQVVEREVCRLSLTNLRVLTVELHIDESVFCAGSTGKDSCKGDSGGPLMYVYESPEGPKTFLMGVVSYGYGCGVEGYPGVYTNVSHHMPWILKNLDI